MMMLMTNVRARLPPPRVSPELGYLTLRCKSEKVGSVRLYFRSAAPYHLKVGNWDSLFLLLWIIVMKSTFIVHCIDKNPNIGSLLSWSMQLVIFFIPKFLDCFLSPQNMYILAHLLPSPRISWLIRAGEVRAGFRGAQAESQVGPMTPTDMGM